MDQRNELGGGEPPRRVSALNHGQVVEPVVVREAVGLTEPVVLREAAVVREPVVVHETPVMVEPVVVHEVTEVEIVPEHQERKPIKEEAKVWWQRAKAGYEKGKAEGEGHGASGISTVTGTGTDKVFVVAEEDLVIEEEVEKPGGIWERIVEVVPGVAAFHGTGRAATHHTGRAGATDGFWNEDSLDPRKPKPLPDVIKDATEEASGLVHAEMALARTEIKARLKVLLPALLLFVVAVTVLLYAVGVLIWAAILGLAHLVPLWASALIIGILMFLLTAGLIFAGLKMIKKISGKRWLTSETIKDDIASITGAFKTKNWENAQEKLKEGRL